MPPPTTARADTFNWLCLLLRSSIRCTVHCLHLPAPFLRLLAGIALLLLEHRSQARLLPAHLSRFAEEDVDWLLVCDCGDRPLQLPTIDRHPREDLPTIELCVL